MIQAVVLAHAMDGDHKDNPELKRRKASRELLQSLNIGFTFITGATEYPGFDVRRVASMTRERLPYLLQYLYSVVMSVLEGPNRHPAFYKGTASVRKRKRNQYLKSIKCQCVYPTIRYDRLDDWLKCIVYPIVEWKLAPLHTLEHLHWLRAARKQPKGRQDLDSRRIVIGVPTHRRAQNMVQKRQSIASDSTKPESVEKQGFGITLHFQPKDNTPSNTASAKTLQGSSPNHEVSIFRPTCTYGSEMK